MRIYRATGTLFLAAALALGLAAAGTAPAAQVLHRSYSMPRIQTYSPAGWSAKQGSWKIAPAFVYFGYGAGYEAQRIKNIHWTYYHHGSAYAAHVRAWWDHCVPTCVNGGHYVNARAYFWHPANHRGPGWNFSEVRVTYEHGGTYYAAYIDGHGGWIAVP